jgi:hypothetical protein
VADPDLKGGLVGQLLQLDLPQTQPVAVAAAASAVIVRIVAGG